MAKQLVNPIERHAEKGIFGLCALILIGVTARYLVTSPNQTDLGGEKVSPSSIDSKLAQRAADVRLKIRNAATQSQKIEPLISDFIHAQDPARLAFVSGELRIAAPFGPEVPLVGDQIAGNAKLVEVVKLPKPVVTLGRSLFQPKGSAGQGPSEPANWVTVSSVFDVKEQRARQSKEYGGARADVIFGAVEVQRRAQRPNGSWMEDDWETIAPYPAPSIPKPPVVQLVNEGGALAVKKEDRGAIDRFVDDLRAPLKQLELLRPLPAPIKGGSSWKYPEILGSERDLLLLDHEFLFPNDPPTAALANRYTSDEALGGVPEHASPQQVIAKKLEEADKLVKSADSNCLEADAIKAFNVATLLLEDKQATASDKTKAQTIRKRAEDLEKEIPIRRATGKCQKGPQQAGGEKKQEQPRQPLWVHDARPDSVKSGFVYQYRLRPQIVNRLAGEAKNLQDRNNATVIFLQGEWSEPTEPVVIARDATFFLATPDENREEIGAELFQWFLGAWVKTGKMKFGIGDGLAGEVRVQVPNPAKPTEGQLFPVPFDSKMTVASIEFKRPYRDRKEKGKGAGVQFGPPTPTCTVAFADEDGRLHERFEPMDKNHPEKKTLSDMLWRPATKSP